MTREPKWTLDDFARPPLRGLDQRAVLLPGDAGIGKTCFAMAHFQRPYVLKTLDQLKDIPGDCDGLIFDDMRFDAKGVRSKPELASQRREWGRRGEAAQQRRLCSDTGRRALVAALKLQRRGCAHVPVAAGTRAAES